MWFAVSCFLFLTCFANLLYAQITQQSNCFTISVVGVPVSDGTNCDTSYTLCGPNAFNTHPCDSCFDVTICNNLCGGANMGIYPNGGIVITSNSSTDCHSVCSHTGQFFHDTTDPGPICSWFNPRTIYDVNPLGIPAGQCLTFRICRSRFGASPQTYHIAYPPGCHGTPCTDAILVF